MEKGLTFSVALNLLKEGQRLAREGWAEDGMYICICPGCPPQAGILANSPDDKGVNKERSWEPTHEDLLAEDWVIVVEPGTPVE